MCNDKEIPEEFGTLVPLHRETGLIRENPLEYNSWIATSDQISLTEMLEIQLINVTAPTGFC
ncbi:hypothetical protein J2Z48_000165 [Croceifilum oryzae]|uniref:Uncharacterized protein n=1 Tax=Croceifilum oryzae TaxID=1553429 RepID=A0AAJ1WNY8_9BACL|nr:hypothetical protein [Croceifilum oryzae]MDQ0416007.1 hypothetical protein [Croceifilum oryzae]